MANYNRATLAGNLTRDPEIRYVQVSGDEEIAVTEFTLAVNRTRSEGVDYIRITAWRELAEIIEEYKKKGDGILIEGRLQYSSWEAEDGSKRSKVVVVAEKAQFLEIAGQSPSGGAANDGEEDGDDDDVVVEEPTRKRPPLRGGGARTKRSAPRSPAKPAPPAPSARKRKAA